MGRAGSENLTLTAVISLVVLVHQIIIIFIFQSLTYWQQKPRMDLIKIDQLTVLFFTNTKSSAEFCIQMFVIRD